eukprot:gene9019-11046_t
MNISGVWAQDYVWVKSYLESFSLDQSSKCYYDNNNPYVNVNWFAPSKFSITAVVSTETEKTLCTNTDKS